MIVPDLSLLIFEMIETLYQALSKHGARPAVPVRFVRSPELTPRQSLIIDQVLDVYGGYSGLQLSAMAHAPESPWDRTVSVEGVGKPIPKEMLRATFREKYARWLERTGETHESLEKAHMDYRNQV